MSAADPVRFRQPVQALGRELADRLQHRVARRRPPGTAHLPQHAQADQLLQAVEHRQARVHRGAAARFADIQAGASGEHRAGREQPPGPRRQQVMAPGDRSPQRLLPVRKVTAAAGQQAQRMLKPGRDRLRRQQPDPRRRQLDGQRQAVQPADNLRDRRRVLIVDGESRYHGGRALGEQPRRLAGGQGRRGRVGHRVRDRKRRDRAFLLAGNAQRGAAAHQDPQGTGFLQQPYHDRCAGQQVLEVIQDEQELPLAQLTDQVVHQRPVSGILQADALGDRRWHQSWIPHRRQRDEIHPVRVIAGHLRRQRDAQPGLAAAAGPGQRDQVAALEQPFRLR